MIERVGDSLPLLSSEIEKIKKEPQIRDQFDLFDNTAQEIADELATLDVTTFTPIEAMNKLYELSKKAKG